MQDEITLWRAILQADSSAFEALYKCHAARMRHFLTFLVRDSAAAEDMAQESFLDFWKRPHNFDPRRSSLKTYLFGIARMKAVNWQRQRGRQQKTAEWPCAQPGETAALMLDALDHLEAEQRNLLWLREVEGHSYDELACIFRIPVGTVRSRLSTSRENLRSIWKSNPTKEKQ